MRRFICKTEKESGTNTKDIKLRGDPVLKYKHQVKAVVVSVSTEEDVCQFQDGVKYLLDHGYEVVGTHAVSDVGGFLMLIALLIKRIVVSAEMA